MDWDPFTALRWLGAVAIAAGLAGMLVHADRVTDAYRSDATVQALNLRPLSFSAATIPPGDPGALTLAVAPDTSREAIDRLAAAEAEVTVPAIAGGSARLHGKVTGLDVDDVGEVRLTRVTDGGRRERTVAIDEDRSWSADDLPGGRYRVRALVPGLRASQASVVLFVADGEERRLDLAVTTPPEQLEFAVVGPDTMTIGQSTVVAITAGRQRVDADGRSVLSPVAGVALETAFSPVVSLLSADVVLTDEGGAARFLVSCLSGGQGTVTFTAADHVAVMTLPPCVDSAPEDPDG